MACKFAKHWLMAGVLTRESEVKIDFIWRIHGMFMGFKLILQGFIEEDIKKNHRWEGITQVKKERTGGQHPVLDTRPTLDTFVDLKRHIHYSRVPSKEILKWNFSSQDLLILGKEKWRTDKAWNKVTNMCLCEEERILGF